MPMPSSETAIMSSSPWRLASTVTVPPGSLYFTPLVRRFQITCCTRKGSMWVFGRSCIAPVSIVISFCRARTCTVPMASSITVAGSAQLRFRRERSFWNLLSSMRSSMSCRSLLLWSCTTLLNSTRISLGRPESMSCSE